MRFISRSQVYGICAVCIVSECNCIMAGAGKKKTLNAGRSGGSAGLEDYHFDTALDDDTDFM